ncbi:MAG: ATP-binding cassette domain-containing protein [Oscillospiraceae bacterium]|nr:ATP-binding cassette domain-containing protein [Oscillospiraceae bacterium]
MLELQSITKRYRSKTALDDVSLLLEPGIWGLLGPNGAGKSTMINIIAGLLAQTSGAVLWDGVNIDSLGASYRAALGFLPQSAGLYDYFTARQYLRYMCALKGLYTKPGERKKRELHISQMLETVNLTADADRRTRTFSGGMKQRLGIAQALLGNPKLIILDEPTSGLDPQERVRLRNAVAALAGSRLIIWATHIVSDIETIAHRVIMLKDGKCIAVGSPAELASGMDGQVWSLTIPAEKTDLYRANYTLGNIIVSGSAAQLRIIHNEKPHPDAVSAEPGLEDLYLLRYEEVSK